MLRASCLALALIAAGCGHRRVLADLEPIVPASTGSRPDGEAASLVLRALMAEADGDAERAERTWRWLVRLRPDDPFAWAGFGGFLERRQRGDDALAAYARAVAFAPHAAAGHLGTARILLGRGDDAGAAPHLHAAATAGDPDAMHLLARQSLRVGDMQGAWSVYDVWSSAPPSRQGECLDRARVAVALERPGDAVDDLRCALDHERTGPEAGEAFVKAARASCRVGTAWRWALDHRVAEREPAEWRAVAVAIGRAVGDPDLLGTALGPEGGLEPGLVDERVEMLVRVDRADEALTLVDEAIRRTPDATVLRLRRAELLARAERFDEALAVLEGVDPADRLSPAAERMRGEIYALSGQPEAAVALMGMLPEPPWATVVVFAGALAASGRLDDAESILQGTGRADEPERWRQIGRLREASGDRAGALQALGLAGDDPRALFDRAVLLETSGLAEDGASAWRRAAEADPRSVAAWLGVARTSSDPEAALRRAVEADRCDPTALRWLAEQRDPCGAVTLLERAWDAVPRDPAVLDALTSAYPACGEVRRAAGEPLGDLLVGLGAVEWTWRVLGRHDEAERVADVHRSLEGL